MVLYCAGWSLMRSGKLIMADFSFKFCPRNRSWRDGLRGEKLSPGNLPDGPLAASCHVLSTFFLAKHPSDEKNTESLHTYLRIWRLTLHAHMVSTASELRRGTQKEIVDSEKFLSPLTAPCNWLMKHDLKWFERDIWLAKRKVFF